MNLVEQLLGTAPAVLAPMEDITDAAFRRMCRGLGASLCMTEFVGAEQIIADSALAQRRAIAGTQQPQLRSMNVGCAASAIRAAASNKSASAP